MLAETRRLNIKPRDRDEDHLRAGLSDVARVLRQFDDAPATRAIESLRARWQNSTTGRRIALVVLLPLVLICLFLGAALNDFVTNEGTPLSPISAQYWRRFLLDWLWRLENVFSLPVAGVATLLLALGSAVFRRLLPQPPPRHVNTEEVARLNQLDTLLRLLERSGRHRRAFVLVVDDVNLLAPTDRKFLAEVSRGALKGKRVLLITRDLGDTAGPVLGDAEHLERLTVPAFSDMELRRIIANHKPDLAGADLDAAVSEARGSLGRVLGADTERDSLQRAVLAEFEQAYEEEVAGDFGVSHLMVY
ncbi:MAG: hypothetical protein M3436_18290 [Pseudomonadota bacterium]|nr:hypothetical protein [Pseudomonadota bacterium]